jgi:hypothetical protein
MRSMEEIGPRLESLLRRLSECPSEFLESAQGNYGASQVVAIVCDHFRAYGEQYKLDPSDPWIKSILNESKPSIPLVRYWGILSISCWLLHDEWFLHRPHLASLTWNWLRSDGLKKLSSLVHPSHCLSDPDRREELVRLCLHAVHVEPLGETLEQSMDRKTTLDSVERQRILQETAEAERRAREVREAMARKQALESASRYGE